MYVHRALLAQGGDRFRHGRRALADGAIDADDVLALLVEDGVDGDGGLARLPVAQDQFALAASDRDERVNDLQPGLQRNGHRRSIHDLRRRSFDRQSRIGGDRPEAVERPTERIDHPPEQPFTDGDIHHPPQTPDFVAGVQMRVVAKQNDADLVFIDVEGDTKYAAGKFEQFLKADARQPGHLGDAGGHPADGADLVRRQLRRKGFADQAETGESTVDQAVQAVWRRTHACFPEAAGLPGCFVFFEDFAAGLFPDAVAESAATLVSVAGGFCLHFVGSWAAIFGICDARCSIDAR